MEQMTSAEISRAAGIILGVVVGGCLAAIVIAITIYIVGVLV